MRPRQKGAGQRKGLEETAWQETRRKGANHCSWQRRHREEKTSAVIDPPLAGKGLRPRNGIREDDSEGDRRDLCRIFVAVEQEEQRAQNEPAARPDYRAVNAYGQTEEYEARQNQIIWQKCTL